MKRTPLEDSLLFDIQVFGEMIGELLVEAGYTKADGSELLERSKRRIARRIKRVRPTHFMEDLEEVIARLDNEVERGDATTEHKDEDEGAEDEDIH